MIAQPQIPEQLEVIADLQPVLDEIGTDAGVSEGLALSHVHLESVQMQATDLMLTELAESCAQNCAFLNCDLSKSWFVDVAFEQCDLSNSIFEDANFTRCTFESCKLTGADITNGVFSQCAFKDCVLTFAILVQGRFADCFFERCDFTGVDMSGAAQKRLEYSECIFKETSFFRMSLDGIDLSDSKLSALTLSDSMEELRGCCMDLVQAAAIAKRLGVHIKEE